MATEAERRRRFPEVTQVLYRCDNTQCRVATFTPHASGSLRGRCPACYGYGGAS